MTTEILDAPQTQTDLFPAPTETGLRLGFTGTRIGLTPAQKKALEKLLFDGLPHHDEYHHGGAIGADAEFHHLVGQIGGFVVLHPGVPLGSSQRGVSMGDVTLPVMEPLARNKAIVNETSLMVACPADMVEESHGGTWFTIRYARKVGKPLLIVWPDGSVTKENASKEQP